MAYRIAAVDDEKTLLGSISRLAQASLEKAGCECVIVPFSDAWAVDDYLYDAFLLDIDMPGLDGIRLARRIRESGSMCPLLFISNVESKVFEALQVQPLRFIRKSHLTEELPEAMSALADHLKRFGSDRLLLKDNKAMLSIPAYQVLYVESFGKVQQVVTPEGSHETHISMQELEKQLLPHGFFRAHRSYLINLSAVYRIDRQEILLKNGVKLPVSRSKVEEAKGRLERMIFHELDR